MYHCIAYHQLSDLVLQSICKRQSPYQCYLHHLHITDSALSGASQPLLSSCVVYALLRITAYWPSRTDRLIYPGGAPCCVGCVQTRGVMMWVSWDHVPRKTVCDTGPVKLLATLCWHPGDGVCNTLPIWSRLCNTFGYSHHLPRTLNNLVLNNRNCKTH